MKPTDATPPTIRGFQIIDEVGVGGYSRVYRALQLSVEREVAVKVLNSPFADDDERAAFQQECKAMGRLEHPHVVRVYDSATTDDGRGCIVMQLYSNTYRDAGRLPIPELVDVGMKVAGALHAAHERDIVHHDVKPHNLFRSADGEPALGDFGISSISGQRASRTRLTLKYAPPELLRDGVSDTRGDLWALGVTLYQLATGTVPFDGTGDEDIIKQIMVATPAPLNRSDAPPALERLITSCLSKNADERPRSAHDVATALRAMQRDVGQPIAEARTAPVERPSRDTTVDEVALGRAKPRPAPSSEPAAAEPEPKSRPWAAIAIGVSLVAILVAAATALVLSRDGTTTSTPTSTSAPDATMPFVVVVPPVDLDVESIDEGYRFTWSISGDMEGIQLRHVGSDDTALATKAPFVWALDRLSGQQCFQARGYRAGRLSVDQTEPVCVDG